MPMSVNFSSDLLTGFPIHIADLHQMLVHMYEDTIWYCPLLWVSDSLMCMCWIVLLLVMNPAESQYMISLMPWIKFWKDVCNWIRLFLFLSFKICVLWVKQCFDVPLLYTLESIFLFRVPDCCRALRYPVFKDSHSLYLSESIPRSLYGDSFEFS